MSRDEDDVCTVLCPMLACYDERILCNRSGGARLGGAMTREGETSFAESNVRFPGVEEAMYIIRVCVPFLYGLVCCGDPYHT